MTDSYFQNFIGKTYAFFAGDEGSESQKGEVKIGWGFEKEEDEDGHSGATPSRQDIAAVSGATKSSNGVRNAVKAALAFYEGAMNKKIDVLKNGIIKNNPNSGCSGHLSTLAVTTSAMNGLSMGLATMFVLVCPMCLYPCSGQ